MNKKFSALVLAIAALTNSAPAQQTRDWSFSLTTTAWSRYVGGTGGALFVDKPVIQTGLFGFHKSGVYVGYWFSKPFNQRYAHTFANETDWIVGYNHDVLGGKINLDVSAAVYDLLPTSDLYALNVTASLNGHPVAPYAVIEHDFAQSASLKPGTIYKLGLRGGVRHLPLTWDAAWLGNTGPEPYGGHADAMSALRLQLGWPTKLGPGTLTPMMVLQQHTCRSGGITRNQTVFGASYNLRF